MYGYGYRLGGLSVVSDYSFSLPNSPSLVLSLRKLNTYSGNCIRVRRSSDNAEQNIGFVNGLIDTSSLLSFCGAGNGFVKTWYDQSGNANDFTNTDNTAQPKIVDSGSLINVNNNVCVDFGETIPNDNLYLLSPSGFLNTATNLSFFSVWKVTDYVNSNGGVFGAEGTYSTGLEILQHSVVNRPSYLRMNGTARNDNAGATYQLWNDATQSLTTILGNNSSVAVYKNSSAVTLTDSSAMPSLNYNGQYAIGRYAVANPSFLKAQELIIYTSDQTANRSTIEDTINDYYSIW